MNIILMKESNDCHNAVIGTACEVSYEAASKAIGHIDLPGPLESPIFSNPWNLYRALIVLGFWKMNVTLQMLLNGDCEPGKTIVLVKKSTTQQHWVVWAGIDGFGMHRFFWGDSATPCLKSPTEVRRLFTVGSPANCAFQVYRANFWRLMLARLQAIFN